MSTQSKTYSSFIKEFSKIYRKSDWMTQEDFAPLYELFKVNGEDNELFIADELEKYSIVKGNEYLSHYHRVMGFILYLGNNTSFKNDRIVVTLKGILEYIANSELPEKYGFTLKILFSINKDDSAYYINEYTKLKDEGKLYHDINEEFLEIFITIKSNELFLESFQQNIIDNATHVYYYSLEKGFRYLLSLDSESFQSILLGLLRFFDIKENKYKLIHYHEYNSLIRTYDKDDFKDILTALGGKILSSGFTDSQINEIKNFIINDIDFAIERHERKLSEILFIDSLFQSFYHQDKSFLLDVLRGIKTKHIALSIETFIIEYLDLSQIEDLIQIYKGGENEMVLYFVYDKFTYLKKEEFITALDNSSMKKEFKKRNKIVLKNQEKYKEKEEKRRLKEKAELFMMLNPGKGKYYPKVFQDYVAYLKKEGGLSSVFTKDEIERINISIQGQIITYLEGINIKNYTDPKIQKILTFEKKESNSYTHTWNSAYLGWILDIAKNIQIDLSKYYKCYVLFFPLLWGSEKIKDTLEIISGHIGKGDIDFIIKAYTEDIHENAKDLRYFHIDSITEFYQKFKHELNKPQKKRLMELSLNVINGDEESNIYVKDNFLKIYSEIGGEKQLKKLFHAWLLKYSHYNYFNDVLDNSETEKEEADKKKFIMFIARELCRTYSSRSTALWAIEQVRNGRIEVIDTHQIRYPHTFSTFSGISEKESEFRWSSDNDSFAYIFGLLSNIDILDEMLVLLDYSLQIQKELYSGDLKGDYESYCFYIRNIFYKYISNLNKKYLKKDLYYEIKAILNKYDYKITYSFDLSKYKKIFGIADIEEEAKELLDTEGITGVIKLLQERDERINQESFTENQIGEIRGKKYIIFVEGPTDIAYLMRAGELLEKKELLEMIDIRIIGEVNNQGETHKSNDNYLLYGGEFLSVNPDFLPPGIEKVLFLNDPENKSKPGNYHNTIFVELMKPHKTAAIKHGIEALFSEEFMNQVVTNNQDYFTVIETTIGGKKERKVSIIQGYKGNIQKWIEDNGTKNDFIHFEHVFQYIDDVINKKTED